MMKKFLTLFCLALPFLCRAEGNILPQNLRCEYLVNPEGIDESVPRLSWTLAAIDPKAFGQRQTAYRVLVSHSQENLHKQTGEVWDSGWVPSDQMQQIEYKGALLASDRTYFWKVAVKDEKGKISPWSAMAHWSTGLFYRAGWSAQWIGAAEVFDPKAADCNFPDPWLRKTVQVSQKPARAMMFVASVGYHELYVNGKKIGDHVLAPAVSDHTKRARYIAYDIAAELKPGKNVIAIWLGTSWSIFEPYGTEDKPRGPIVIAQADLYAKEAPQPFQRIVTDNTWKTHPSPNQLLGTWKYRNMGGELWDANREIADWNLPDTDETNWKAATIYKPKLTLSAQMVEPNRLFHPVNPVAIQELPGSNYRVDMGVNFAGWTEIRLRGNPGQRIDLLFSEREQDEMTFSIHSAYIPGKTGEGVFKNHFNYSSGRWITIKGLKEKPVLSDIRGWVVRTDYQANTRFECSDPFQNWLYDRICWNYENITLGGYVVDCPQRERLGYGDANESTDYGMMQYRTTALYSKWLEDWRDTQGTRFMSASNYGGRADDGILPHTAPTYTGGGGPAWGGFTILLPWLIYQQEGDTRVIEKTFDTMKRWLAFLDSHTQNDQLVRFGGIWDFLGDWLWPNATAEGMNNDKPENVCFNNSYRVYNLRLAAKMARLIGRIPEAKRWEQQAGAAAQATHARYYHAADRSYADSSMTNIAMALLAEVPPPALRKTIEQRLENEIMVARKGHIDSGIMGGSFLFNLLRQLRRDDLMYAMTSQQDYPGWGYMKANGATALWEMWEKDLPGHSLLHHSYLFPGAWYLDGISGIRHDPEKPGFRTFIIRPPHLKESQISWAKTTLDSPAGIIDSRWERKDGHLTIRLTVPPNTSARVYFPAEDGRKVRTSSAFAKLTATEAGYHIYNLPAGTFEFSN